MNSTSIHSRWARRLGASLCAFLVCFSATAAYANADRVSVQLNNLRANTNWRAERAEHRESRRNERLNEAIRVQSIDVTRHLRNGERFDRVMVNQSQPINREVRSGRRLDRNSNGPRATNHTGVNRTAEKILFPGQISPFHTKRPERGIIDRNGRSTYTDQTGNDRSIRNGLSLDLSSTESTIKVGSNLLTDSVTIEVGGQSKEIVAGSKVTAAEYAALNQKIATGSQGLTLDNKGTAIGGSFDINMVSDEGKSIRASELVIPKSVSVSGDFARHAEGVRVTGDLVNAGSIYAVSTSNIRTTAIIGARDVNNQEGGLITTDAPSAIASKYGSTESEVDLSIKADRDLNNAGSITSSGDLTLSAGRVINNSSSRATAIANGRLNLISPEVNNKGLLRSDLSDIQISGPADSDLVVNSTGGEFRAANDINIDTNSLVNSKLKTTIIGGDWHSDNLNIQSSDGEVSANVGEVSGLVNIKTGVAHFNADTANLHLGQMDLSGDPTFTSSGNLTLSGLPLTTSGNPLALIAGNSISAGTATTLDTSNGSGAGGSLTLIAGADFTVDGSNNVHITGASASGGAINLTGISTIDTSGTTSGGNLQVVAFDGTPSQEGVIVVPQTTTILTGGASGANGNVSMIAGGAAGIIVGPINSTGGNGGGNVLLASATPTIVGGEVVINNTGAITSGSITAGTLQSGIIAATTVTADGDITALTQNSLGFTGTISGNAIKLIGGDIFPSGTITADSTLEIAAYNSITAHSIDFIAPGGIVMVAKRDVRFNINNNAMSINSSSSSGDAGNIFVGAGVDWVDNGTSLQVLGASAFGGSFSGPGLSGLTVDASSSSLTGDGGDISIIAYNAIPHGATDGQIGLPFSTFNTKGGLLSQGGNVVIVGPGTGPSTDLAITVSSVTSGGGDVIIQTSQPGSNFQISTGTDFGSVPIAPLLSGTPTAKDIELINGTGISAGGGDISLIAGGNVKVTSGQVGGATDLVIVGGIDVLLANLFADPITIVAGRDIILGGSVVADGGILMVANRNISTSTSGLIIDTHNAAGAGGDITMIAGADFSTTATELIVTNGSSTGGSINLLGVNALTSTGTTSGGDISLLAFAGLISGIVSAPVPAITTGGAGSNTNGNLLVMAGAVANGSTTSTIRLGPIDTTGGSGGGGNVSVYSANPVISGNSVIFDLQSGALKSGSFTPGTVQQFSGSGTSLLTNPITASGDVFLSSGGKMETIGITASTITLLSKNEVDLRANIKAPGGILVVGAQGISSSEALLSIDSSSSTGSAGNIVLVADADFTDNGSSVTFTAVNPGGLGINFPNGSTPINLITSQSTASTGQGGDITLVTYRANLTFPDSSASEIHSGGSNAANGNVTILGPGVVRLRSMEIDTTGGTTGSGDVTIANNIAPLGVSVSTAPNSLGEYAPNAFFSPAPISAGGVTVTNVFTDNASVLLRGAESDAVVAFDNVNGGTVKITGFDVRFGMNTGIPSIINASTLEILARHDVIWSPSDDQIKAPGGIVIIAGRDLFMNSSPQNYLISSATLIGQGDAGDIFLGAGVDYLDLGSEVSVIGVSSTGGSLAGTQGGNALIDSSSQSVGRKAGDIAIVVYKKNAGDDGVVALNFTDINAHAGLLGAGGNVTIVGKRNGLLGEPGILVRNIDANASGGLPGTITLQTSQPGDNYSVKTSQPDFGQVPIAPLLVNPIADSGVTISGTVSGDVFVSGGFIDATFGRFTESININLDGIGDIFAGDSEADPITFTAGRDIILNGDVTASGGILMVAGRDIKTNSTGIIIDSSSSDSDAGAVTLISGATFTNDGAMVSVTGASSTGGSIDLKTNAISALTAGSSFADGSGGGVTLVALDNGTGSSGNVLVPTGLTITTGGTGSGSNGDITVVASGISTNSIQLGNLNTTGGASGSGNIDIRTADIVASVGSPIDLPAIGPLTGQYAPNAFFGGSTTISDISAGSLTSTGGTVTVVSGRNAVLGSVNVSGTDGGVIDITTNGTASLNVNGAGSNRTGILTANAGAIGDGGIVRVKNSGALGLNVIAGSIVTTITDGDGATVELDATNGVLSIAGFSTINVDGAGTDKDGGSVSLIGASIIAGTNISLSANATGTADGGNIYVQTTGNGVTSDIIVDSGNNQFALSASGPNGSISVKSGRGLTVNSALTSDNITIQSDNLLGAGDITLGADIIGSNQIKLSTNDAITQLGQIQGGDLIVQFGTGPLTLSTAVDSIAASAAGQSLTVNESTGIQILGQNLASLNVTTAAGDITVDEDFSLTDKINLTAQAGSVAVNGNVDVTNDVDITASGGNISIAGNLASNSAAGSINLTATRTTPSNGHMTGNGIISTNPGSSTGLTINLLGASSGDASFTGSNSVNLLNSTGGGTVTFNNGSTALDIGSLGNTQSLVVYTTNAATGVAFTETINTTGTITINTPRLFNDQSISAGGAVSGVSSIIIQNLLGNLTVVGGNLPGGILTGNEPPSTGFPNPPTVPPAVLIKTGIGASLKLVGDMEFNGDLQLDNFGGTTTSSIGTPDSLFHGNDNVRLLASNWIQNGATNGGITGNDFVFEISVVGGTIINTQGSVNFTTDTTLVGQDFSIVARDSVNLGSVHIDLNNGGVGNAGSLSIIAGYNFVEDSGGQIQTLAPYTFSTASAGGGNVTATNAIFDTSASGGPGNDAGNVLIVAQKGLVDLGTSTILANAGGGKGGDVTIIGQNGITVGDINVAGAVGGSVELSVSAPQQVFDTVGPIVVTDGTISGGTFASTSTTTAGDIIINEIAGATSVKLQGALTASDTISQSGSGIVSAVSNLTVQAGNGATTLKTQVATLNTTVSGTGLVSVDNGNSPLQLGTVSGSNQDLTVITNGQVSTTGGNFTVDELNITGNGTVALGVQVTANGSSSITASGGDVFIVGGLIGTGAKTVSVGAGTIRVQGALSGSTVGLTTNGGDILQTAAGVVTATTLNVTLDDAGTADLTDAANAIGTINTSTTNGGSIALTNGATDLKVGTITSNFGNQDLDLRTTGTLDLTDEITADDLVLIGGGTGLSIDQNIIASSSALFRATAGDLTVNSLITITGVGDKTLETTGPGDLQIDALVYGNNVTLRATNGGDIHINSLLQATGGILTLETTGGDTDQTATGGFIAPTLSVVLNTPGSTVDLTAAINTVSNLNTDVTGTGTVKVRGGIDDLTLINISGSSQDLQVSTTTGSISTTMGLDVQVDKLTLGTARGALNINSAVTIASGATLQVTSNSATTSINVNATGSVSGSTADVVLSNNGSGDINVNNFVTGNTIDLIANGGGDVLQSANGVITTTGSGGLTVTLTTGDALLNVANNQINELNTVISGSGLVTVKSITDLDINNIAGANQDLSVTSTGHVDLLAGFSVDRLTVDSTTGGLAVGVSLTTTGDTNLTALNGNVSLSGSLIGSGDKTLEAQNGQVSAGGSLFGNNITLKGSTGIMLTTNLSPTNDVTIQSSTGTIQIGGTITGTNVSLSVVDGSISQTAAITAAELNIESNNGVVTLVSANAVDTINTDVSGNASILFNNGSTNLELGTISGADQALNVSTTGKLSTTTDILVRSLALQPIGTLGLELNGNIAGTDTIFLNSGGAISQNSGKISGGELEVRFSLGSPLTLTTDVEALKATTTGQILNINEDSGIELRAINMTGSTLSVNASQTTAGNITDSGAAITTGGLNLNNSQGDIVLTSNITSSLSASFVASGDIMSTGVIQTASASFDAGNDIGSSSTPVRITNLGNSLNLTVVSTGDTFISSTGTGQLTLGQNGATSADDFTLTANGTVALSDDLSLTGTFDVTTNSFSVGSNLAEAASISIKSRPTFGLSVSGSGGTLTATTGDIDLTATASNLDLIGTMTLNTAGGVTNLNAGMNQSIVVNAGANFTGNDQVNANTCSLILQGILTGDPLVLNCGEGAGTIANSLGSVNLASNLQFNGLDLAIIAATDINTIGATSIDLSGAIAGNLTLIAGYNFSPDTGGQVGPNNTVYTFSGSGSGGNINLGTVNVLTSSSAGRGGDVIAAANGNIAGTKGFITLGAITTGGTIAAGNVTIIGEHGVTVNGAIAGTGAIVTVAAAHPSITGTLVIGAGEIISGSIAAGTATAGDIALQALNIGNGSGAGVLNVTGASNNGDVIAFKGTVSSGNIFLTGGAGTITQTSSGALVANGTNGLTISLGVSGSADLFDANNNVNKLSGTGAGIIDFDNGNNNLILGTFGGNQALIVEAGLISTSNIISLGNISLTGTNSAGLDAVSINNDITTTGALSIFVNGGNLTINGHLDAGASDITLERSSGTGDITETLNGGLVAMGIDVNLLGGSGGAANLTAGANNVLFINTNVNGAGSVSLNNGANNLAIDTIIGAGQNLTITTTGDMTTAGGNFTVNQLDLQATNLGLGVDITANGTASITGTTGDVQILSGGSLIGTGVKNLTVGTGDIFIDGAVSGPTVTITTNGGTASQSATGVIAATALNAVLSNAGSITLVAADNVVATLNTNVTGDGSITFDNGSNNLNIGNVSGSTSQDLSVATTGSINLTTGFSVDQLALIGGGANLEIDVAVQTTGATLVRATGGADVTLTSTGSLTGTGDKTLATIGGGDVIVNNLVSGDSVVLLSTGDIQINGSAGAIRVQGTTNISIDAANTIAQIGGVIAGGDLAIDFTTGPVVLTTDVTSLTTSGGTTLTINEDDGIALLGQTVTNLTVNAGRNNAGDITTGAASSYNGTLTLDNNNGDIVVSQATNATGTMTIDALGAITVATGGSLGGNGQKSLTVNTGDITLNGAVSGSSINLTTNGKDVHQNASGILTTAGTLTVNLGVSGVATLDAIASNVGTLSGVGGGVLLFDNGANNLLLGTLGANQDLRVATTGQLTTTGDITTTGAITLDVNKLVNGFDMSAASITVTSQSGSGLSVSGSVGGTFTATGSGETVKFTATDLDLDLLGNLTFGSSAEMFALIDGVQTFRVNTGANVVGQHALTVNACDVELIGNIVGSPLTFVCDDVGLTIANSQGDVNLTGDIEFLSQSVAIIAANSILPGSATRINLNNPGGAAGSLTLIAGYDFTPATPGQVFDGTTLFSNFTPNAQGGSIVLNTVSINLSSGTSTGGNLIAVANGGSNGDGVIFLGNVNTSGTIGGNVTLISEKGIQVGTVNTTGTTTSGDVNLSLAQVVVNGTPTVLNGVLSGGAFSAGTAVAGNIEFNTINAGTTGDVSLQAALLGNDTIGVLGASSTVIANVLSINAGVGTVVIDNSSVATFNSTANGNVSILNESDSLTLGTIAGATQNLTVVSKGTLTTGATALNLGTISLTGENALGFDAINLNADITAAGDINLTSNSDGDVSVASGLTIRGANIALVGLGNGKINLDGMLNAGTGTVRLQAGGNLLDTDVDLSNVTAGTTILASTNGDIGNRAGGDRFNTDLTNLNLQAFSGNVFVQSDITEGVLTINGFAGQDFDVTATGIALAKPKKDPSGIILNDITTTAGDINIAQNMGNMLINAGANINANEGDINLSITSTDKKEYKRSVVTFGAGVTVEALATTAGLGNLTVTVGPQAPTAGKPPTKNVTINESLGGAVLFGQGISVDKKGPINVLTAKGASITFNGTKKKSIGLNGGNFTADPPVAVSIPEASSSAAPQTSGSNTQDNEPSGLLSARSLTSSAASKSDFTNDGTSSIYAFSNLTLNTANMVSDAMFNSTSNDLPTTLTIGGTRRSAPGMGHAPHSHAIDGELNGLIALDCAEMNVTDGIAEPDNVHSITEEQDAGELIVDAALHTDKDLGLDAFAVAKSSRVNFLSASTTANVKQLQGSKRYILNHGNVVFAPFVDTTIKTPHGTVWLAAHSVALVMETKHGLAVYDIHDNRKNAVLVHANQQQIHLSPGRHVLLSDHTSQQFDAINPVELIQYRGLTLSKLNNGLNIYTSEFSIPSACYAVKPLAQLMSSKHKEATKLSSHILKTTAALMSLSPDKGDFVQFFKSRTTAMK